MEEKIYEKRQAELVWITKRKILNLSIGLIKYGLELHSSRTDFHIISQLSDSHDYDDGDLGYLCGAY